jgi:hypothetical protein
MRRGRRRWISRLVLLAAVLVVGLFVADFVAGRFFVPASGSYPPELFVHDASRGLALAPHFSAVVTRAGISFPISINSAGYRDVEWQDDGRTRLLLVGSSATFGVGLARDAGIAAKLGAALGPQVQVLNTGVYSYGPPQILKTIEKECPALRPRLVLYLYEYKTTRRDFLTNRIFPAADDPASAAAAPEPAVGISLSLKSLRAFLSLRDLHPRQIGERLFGLDRLSPQYLLSHYASTLPSAEFTVEGAKKAAQLIIAMDAAARNCGARFAMAILPGPAESYYGLREPMTELVLKQLAENPQRIPLLDTRIGIPLGSDFTLPGLDYPNEAAATWVVDRLTPFATRDLALQ